MNRLAAILFFFLLSAPALVWSQGVTPTKGKDFWLGFMKNYETEGGESLDLFIVSDVATTGTVSVPGQGWTFDFTVNPNQTTTVTIPNATAEVMTSGVIENKGVHVETADTVAVFAISFNPYTADGTKVLPTPTLGTNYMVAAYSGLSPWDSEFLVVATEDDTEVVITPSVATNTGQPAGVPFTISLDAGQCYQVMATGGGDLTGSTVVGTEASGSCRPFAVFSGAGCTNLPSNCIACDHIYEENFPVELWGTEYYISPFVFELNPGYAVAAPNYTWRVLALQDGTSVSVDGGASFTLNAGEYDEVQFDEDAHCVIADAPIVVIQYMEGISCGGNGDPAMLILDDVSKKIDNITFSTVESTVITSHYLNVIIDASDLGSVTLDGAVIDPNLFESFPNCPDQMWAGFEITEGSHTLDAPGGGVTGYVYGNGDAESYAYSVGSFSPLPPIIIDDALCTNDEVTLQIAGNYTDPYWYNYTDPETILAEGYTYVLVPPIENGIYVGVGNEFVSGCEEEFYFSVEVPEPPDISVTPNGNINICQYESVQLNVEALPSSAVYYYEWTPSAGLSATDISNPVATPLQSTTYEVTVSTPSGCGTNTGSVTINVDDGVVTRFEATPEEAFFCVGDGIAMSAETEMEAWADDFDPGVSWGDWDVINNGTESAVCGTVSGNALYFNGTGDRSALTEQIDCTPGGTIYFSLKIANGAAPCDNAEPGDNVVLEYTTNGVAFTTIATLFESGYPDFTSVSYPIPAGAQTATTQFRWRQVGAFANGQDNWVLDNVYVGVIATDDFDYTWTPSAGLDQDDIPDPTATPSETTTYYVEIEDPQTGCTYIDSVLVDVGQPFSIDLTPDTALCDVQGIELYAIPDIGDPDDYDYAWTPNTNITGSGTSTPTVTPNVTTTYEVVVTSPQGCVVEGAVEITVSALLNLDVNVSDDQICAGEEIDLNAVMGGNPADVSFTWSPATWVEDPSDPTTTATPFDDVTYTMTAVHEPSGCTLTESVDISVLQVFTVDAQPDDTTACITDGMQITATTDFQGALVWQWTPAALLTVTNGPNTEMTQNTSAELIVTATNQANCSARDTVFVTLLVETTDLGPDTAFCEDQSLLLDTGWPDDYTFEWSNGESTSSIEVNESGTYSVEVTSPLGCFSTDEVEVDVFTYPVVDLGEDRAFCQGETETLNAGPPGLNYNWSTGATIPEIVVSTTDFYEVTVDNGYCFTTDGVNIVFNPLPVDPFSDGTTFCFGYPPYVLELDAMNPGSTYVWNTGSTQQIIEALEAGYYSVLITSAFGCQALHDLTIEEDCPGVIWIPNSFTPDNDGLNDAWIIKGENISEFHLQIWNRWGELFYESTDLNKPWLGQRRDGDYYVETGTYLYKITVRLLDENGALSDQLEFNGHVNLIR